MFDLELHQMDVKTAFLNGHLQEEIYMKQPEGYTVSGSEHLVCRLKKTLYGLKQSPPKKINRFLKKHGFKRVEFDYGLYIIWNDTMKFVIGLYVVDLLLACNRQDRLNVMKQLLSAEYELKDLGEAKFVLGIEIERDRQRRTIYLNQSKYVEEVLERFRMSDCKPCSTPLDAGLKLCAPSESDIKCDPAIPYQSAVGSLMYAMTSTRPDLAFAVSTVSRYCSNYTTTHWQAVKQTLRYLQYTKHYRLRPGGIPDKGVVLSAYCDADWANDRDTRKSVCGHVFTIGDGVVSWNSKLMATPALSATEAEYMTTTHAAKEAMWLRQLLAQMGFTQEQPTVIRSDNQGAIALSKHPGHHSRTKHIDLRHHFIRYKVESGDIQLMWCPTEDMTADVLTKPLARVKHQQHCVGLGLESHRAASTEDTQSGSVVSSVT